MTPKQTRRATSRTGMGSNGGGVGDDIFFSAIELARLPMVVTDPTLPDHPIVFANQAFSTLTGYPPAELLGRNCRFLQGPETSEESRQAIRDAIAARTNLAIELMNYHRDGTPFWNALFISPVFGPDGQVRYFFGSQLDVTRRREAEARLHHAQKMEAVGELAGGIAHDFNNLLTVIAGNTEMLANATDPLRRHRHADRLHQAVERARRLTGQLLAFARRQQLDLRPLSLNDVVRGLQELTARTLGAGIEVRTDLAEGLAECRLDPAQLELALAALLLNARDAMPQGGSVTIRTLNHLLPQGAPELAEGLTPGHHVALVVEDTGHGMPPAVLRRATEPFFTTRQGVARGGLGLGLGLAGVHGFVHQSHGHLVLQSEPGRGTRVRLLFPAERGTGPAPADLPGGCETILVVDDDPRVTAHALELLTPLGYRVLVANSGDEALAVLRVQPEVALLFSDIVMPGGMDGHALAQAARNLRPGLHALLTSGFPEHHVEVATGLPLPKPYGREDLARRVRASLDAGA